MDIEKKHSKSSGHPGHSVIYLETDSEITEAIDKLKAAHGAEIRVAVPARSAMLQSAVNLKLLKKTAHESNKKLVLVSSDKATLSLAAGLGIMVAKNVKAEAAVPDMPSLEAEAEGSGFAKQHISLNDEDKSSEDEPAPELKDVPEADEVAAKPTKPAKAPREKKVPNFNGLNKKIMIIVIAVVILLLLIAAYIFFPTAKVTLAAKAQRTPLNVKFSLDSGTKKSNLSEGTLAAEQVSSTKELSGQFQATGQKDVGQKATGTISVCNKDDGNPREVAAGTTVTSSGKSFTTTQAATIPPGIPGGGVVSCGTKVDIGITATANGDSFNLGGANFVINGLASNLYPATGSTSGGSTRVVTVVTQADIDKAKKDLLEQNTASAKQELKDKTQDDMRAFEETFTADGGELASSVPVDGEAATATMAGKVKFALLSANTSELDEYFSSQIQNQVPGNNQIYQSGANDARYQLIKSFGPEKADIQASGNAYYGEKIDIAEVAKMLSGQSRKSATDIVQSKNAQVSSVIVDTVPLLIPNLPFMADKIKVEIKVNTD